MLIHLWVRNLQHFINLASKNGPTFNGKKHNMTLFCQSIVTIRVFKQKKQSEDCLEIAPVGFEPTHSGTRSHRLTAWPRGNYSIYFTGSPTILQVEICLCQK